MSPVRIYDIADADGQVVAIGEPVDRDGTWRTIATFTTRTAAERWVAQVQARQAAMHHEVYERRRRP